MIALAHRPSPRMAGGERTFVPSIPIDLDAALRQHEAYCRALESLGASVRVLDANHQHADSTFIEDVAVVLDEVAVLASMGTSSRRPEPLGIEATLRGLRELRRVEPPAAIEGGDVLRVGRTLLVGLSSRTNRAGVDALAAIAGPHGYRVLPVVVHGCLHLKTACTALPDARLLVNAAWLDPRGLDGFALIAIPPDEPWAANTLPLGGRVLMAADHAKTAELVRRLGHEPEPVDISEFAKAEGGVTCLSIIVNS